MGYIIRATYGSVSDPRFKLTKAFSRVGSDPDCDLILFEEGLPELAVLVERKSGAEPNVYCKAGNSVKLGGRALAKGEKATWSVEESLDVCGAVELSLEKERKEKSRPDEDRADVSMRRSLSMNSYANSQTRLTNVSRINASRLDASRLDPTKVGAVDLNNDVVEPKKADNSKQTMQLLVILVCALTVVLFVFKSQNDKGGSNGLSTAPEIAWQVQKEGDEQLAEDVRAAYVNEWSQPVVAKASYKAIEYNVKLRLEDPNDKLSQATLEKVLNVVEARLAALDSVL